LLWSLGLQSSRQAFNNSSNIRYVSQIEAKDNSKQEQKGVINVRSVQEPKDGVCNHSYMESSLSINVHFVPIAAEQDLKKQ